MESIANEIILMKKGKVIEKATPYELLEQIRDNVYEIEVPAEQIEEVQKKYIVSNLRYIEGGMAVKVLTDKRPEGYDCKKAVANLEDVYLYHFEK